jgi:hypothetical protein
VGVFDMASIGGPGIEGLHAASWARGWGAGSLHCIDILGEPRSSKSMKIR